MKEKLTSRDLQARETREKLMRISMELIAREGYQNVTIQRICRECGVSVGTFYQYFQSKRDIITLLTRQHNEYFNQANEEEFTGSAREIYLNYVDTYMHRIADSGYVLSKSLMLGTLEANIDSDAAGLPFQKEFFRRLIRYGRERGEFSDHMEADDFFAQFIVTINGILVNWIISGGRFDVVDYGGRLAGQLLKLLERE